ncbi:hypothetical protein SLW70_04555 [Flavobacterium sp. NG2]|uniref:hypothetical protein n=1 Tax=Flavobacterium sp. NG2 TaxID=3097547 RepID=UPI002A841549|nr:hypothetical protein [Flavobacterium sp. NG2]WPR72417.1 hypothetical protein SLW70_04555 [Flavobacterium sp. NG2]
MSSCKMKKYILYISIFIFLFFNIKCSSDKNLDLLSGDNLGEKVAIKVKEYKTNLPLPGVKFSTYYCKGYDQYVGCINEILLSSCVTDSNGSCNCSFPKKAFEKVTIEKPMYWSKQLNNYGDFEYIIHPEAWVNVNFKTDAVYPSSSTFFIIINGELQFVREYIQAINNSNKVFRLFGNEENKVDWVLYKTFNSNSDILNSGSFILNPKKFENLTYTLTY